MCQCQHFPMFGARLQSSHTILMFGTPRAAVAALAATPTANTRNVVGVALDHIQRAQEQLSHQLQLQPQLHLQLRPTAICQYCQVVTSSSRCLLQRVGGPIRTGLQTRGAGTMQIRGPANKIVSVGNLVTMDIVARRQRGTSSRPHRRLNLRLHQLLQLQGQRQLLLEGR